MDLSFKEPMRCQTSIILVERGCIRHDAKPWASWIIPLRLRDTSGDPEVQFDEGPGSKGEVKKWYSLLPLVAIEGDTCIRVINEMFAFIWVKWYKKTDPLDP